MLVYKDSYVESLNLPRSIKVLAAAAVDPPSVNLSAMHDVQSAYPLQKIPAKNSTCLRDQGYKLHNISSTLGTRSPWTLSACQDAGVPRGFTGSSRSLQVAVCEDLGGKESLEHVTRHSGVLPKAPDTVVVPVGAVRAKQGPKQLGPCRSDRNAGSRRCC